MSSRIAGTATAGLIAGGVAGGPAGALVGAVAGGSAGAAMGFLLELATRSFDKAHLAKKNRAELFARIAEKLATSPDASQ